MQFITDLVNLTQGQLLIKYWWLWAFIITAFLVYARLFATVYKITKKVFKNAYREYKKQI